jgi:hypothetical protein
MIAFAQLIIYGLVGLSVLYLLLSVYSRSVERERLEKAWDADPPEGAGETERRAYIERGMEAYSHSLRRKLIWLVYVVPTVLVAVLLYFVNRQ